MCNVIDTDGKRADLISPFVGQEERWLAILIVSMCLQNIDVIKIGSGGITLFHLVVLLANVSLAISQGARSYLFGFVSSPMLVVVSTVSIFVVSSLASISKHGVDPLLLNYIFLLFVARVGYFLAMSINRERISHVFRVCATAMLSLVLLNALVHADDIAGYLTAQWDGHPSYPTIFDGGVNLEATWPAMFGVFFSLDKKGVTYHALVLLYSLLVSSRAGMILTAMSFLYLILKSTKMERRKKIALGAVFPLLGILLIVVLMALGVPVAERFLSIGADGGSLGRVGIWSQAIEVFCESPLLGCGAGNAMDAIRENSGIQFQENNVHNIYLQILIDFGIVGFVVYLALVVMFIRQLVKTQSMDNAATFIAIYLVIGFLQFRGGEPLLGLVMGLWMGGNLSAAGKLKTKQINGTAG